MKNKVYLVLLSIVLCVVLTGCGATHQPITSETQGIWNHFFIYPMSWLLIFVANIFHGSYGLSIVIVTVFVRIMLLPLMLKQQKSSRAMQALRPDMEEIKKKYGKVSDKRNPKETQTMQKELMTLYQQNGVNPVAGCLPLFVQMPVMMAFYFAIMRTQEISLHTFLWFDLGQPDPLYILPFVAGLTTFLQVKMTSFQLQGQMNLVLYIMPVMIIVAGVSLPSALSLYWVVGNLFMIIQTYFTVVKAPQIGSAVAK